MADPLDPAAWNRFSYVHNAPTNYVDPSGHIPIWDILDIGSFLWSSHDLLTEPSWANLGWWALDLVSLLSIIPSVGLLRDGDEAADLLRAAGRVEDAREAECVIEIYGFRGAGTTAEEFIEIEALIYAGHVGISFDRGKTIYGFTPHAPDLSSAEIIETLKRKKSFPGQVLDDTAIFHRAQDLAEQGYRTQVYVQSIPVPNTDFNRIRKQVLGEVGGSPLVGKRYAFPGPKGCYNCATWPASHGIPIPEPTGQLRDYIPRLMELGRPWKR